MQNNRLYVDLLYSAISKTHPYAGEECRHEQCINSNKFSILKLKEFVTIKAYKYVNGVCNFLHFTSDVIQ